MFRPTRPTQRLMTVLTGGPLLLTLLMAAACPDSPLAPPVAPTIATAPVNITVTSGAPASFSVTAAGTAPFSYQWSRDSTDIAGATAPAYSLPATLPADSGAMFRVAVSNAAGTITSPGARLTVLVPPAITQQPFSLTALVGSSASFRVTVTGSSPSYQWQRNGADIGGATGPGYTLPAAAPSDSGATFRVVASNAVGSATSTGAVLTVLIPPAITTQPQSTTVPSGQPGTFGVAATGSGPLSFQWQRNGLDIGGATGSTLLTTSTTLADDGAVFRVIVSNAAGSVSSSGATLTVRTPPAITVQPLSLTVIGGSQADFMVTASGSAPLSYQWQRNGVGVGGATSASYTLPATTLADSGATFRVVVTNSVGSATSTGAVLTVLIPPAITTQPQSTTVPSGQPGTFGVAATGSGPLSFQWQRNGLDIGGATGSTLLTTSTTLADDGAVFRVIVSNAAGSATSTGATLTVLIPPTITVQPLGLTVASGSSAGFVVTATGSAPLSYQWQRNSSDLAGETNASYTLAAAAPADDGAVFRVIVGNAAGTATSAGATLTVLVPPAITVQPLSLTVAGGSNAGFLVAATGSAPLSYQWQRNGVDIGGATTPTYTLASAGLADNGAAFRAVVTNVAGTATSNAATLTVTAPPLVTSAAVAAGGSHSLGLKSDGTVWAWGGDGSGQLGNGLPKSDSPSPVQVSGLSSIVRIAAGQNHSLALRSDGTVWAWGDGSFSQLGNGGTAGSATPVQVTGLTNVVGISAGRWHSLAIKSDGTVWTWGTNSSGQLGDGSNSASSIPLQVSLVYGLCLPVSPASCTSTPGVRAFAAGWIHSLVQLNDLTARGWGDNFRGEIGSGAGTGGSTTPVPIDALFNLDITQLGGGNQYSLALLADSTILRWGQFLSGGASPTPSAVSGLSGVAQIAAGYEHAVALKSDGTVWGWGRNDLGQLTGNSSSYFGPNQIGFNSGAKLNGAMAIGAGETHTLVLKQDGTVWAFGDDQNCKLGRGCQGTTFSRDPVQVVGLKLF